MTSKVGTQRHLDRKTKQPLIDTYRNSGRNTPKKRVLVGSGHNDPYINSEGEMQRTKVHDLVYSERLNRASSRRKEREVKNVMEEIKMDWREISTLGGG